MNIRKRIILLAVYVTASCVASLFFVAGGHASLQVIPIFESWTYVAGGILPESWSPLAFLIIFALYLFGLLCLNNVLRRFVHFPAPIVPLAIHGAGTWVGLRHLGRLEVPTSYSSEYVLATWLIPVAMVIIYFTIEWRLATRAAAGRKNVDHGVPG
jgi:hypothetical protein